MVVFPTCKINLGLNIIAKRPDGFHNIESCFYPVGWTDVLEMVPAESFAFASTGIPIPGDAAGNLCVKAYQFLQKDFSLPPVSIHLHKVIPIGAGLGGGSADGAFCIKLLNQVFALNLTVAQMQEYARRLGSDCAFFIENTPVFCYGKGDQFRDIQVDLSKYYIALVNPQIHIGTAEAYAGITPAEPERKIEEILALPIERWKEYLINDFEKNIFANYPGIRQIKDSLYTHGAVYASMSGSGSTVYGIFEKETDVKSLFPEHYQLWQGKL
ncbi:4-(cytidine 5'-diphospho)-2-C-methyl-D-erythritol kinase [Rhodocytophaga aerolata]|uniref:4-diphosphocytidyl-2-C-methyl-D-erythritol kinase n=1 Tax=Rhodocytophaga aerolata TaxID=455078 RepID=A0ABT8R3F7_9BACT|nr:4-(cytidine 5'-diphospho)-2-C-methyl-D-erythritol kinase [Rhodocytophaga aerolata]MDO1445738.1 4-(cytidine 5'-diphospho)-2-C-methyl-D-erythritol kinase [Rhodocytophaga aerolata]